MEGFGIESKFKLDPKVVLALQGAIYREIFGIGDCTLVQGADSVQNTFPLAVILDDHFDTKYLPVGYLPKVDLNEVNENSDRDTSYSGEELDSAVSLQDIPCRTSETVRRIVYDVISGQYLTRCKLSHMKVDDLAVEQLKQINNLFYGQTTQSPTPVE